MKQVGWIGEKPKPSHSVMLARKCTYPFLEAQPDVFSGEWLLGSIQREAGLFKDVEHSALKALNWVVLVAQDKVRLCVPFNL